MSLPVVVRRRSQDSPLAGNKPLDAVTVQLLQLAIFTEKIDTEKILLPVIDRCYTPYIPQLQQPEPLPAAWLRLLYQVSR